MTYSYGKVETPCEHCVYRRCPESRVCDTYKEWEEKNIKSFSDQFFSILDRNNVDPVVFVEKMLGIKLLFYQKILLREAYKNRSRTFITTYIKRFQY